MTQKYANKLINNRTHGTAPVGREAGPGGHRGRGAGSRRRGRSARTAVEELEGRTVLSFFLPTSAKIHEVRFGGAAYLISVSGPGAVATSRGRGGVAIKLAGTTQDSQVSITALGSRSHGDVTPLQVSRIDVRSHRIGSIQGLTTADLDGSITQLTGPVNTLQFDAVQRSANIDIQGNLNQLAVNRGVDLGPGAGIAVSGDIVNSVSVAANVTLRGGRFAVGRDLAGSLTVGGSLNVTDGGSFSVNRNLGNAPSGGASASGVTIAGDVILATKGTIAVGRNASSVAINGNLDTSAGGSVAVSGNLAALTVTGSVHGSGSGDVVVSGNLGQLTVLGRGDGAGGVRSLALSVGENLQGLDVRFGIVGSRVAAGNLIDGGTPGAGSNGWNIGSLGGVSVSDTLITAGSEIRNLTIGGNVQSDLPTNLQGTPTRIVAGEAADGHFVPGGVIDNFQILGSLIDGVVAASVEPLGGTYHQPAGTQAVVTGSATPNGTAPPFAGPSDVVLPGGSINPSFAPAFQVIPPNPPAGTKLPLPSKPTVLGGVITTATRDGADFAGLFAANTNGVFVGPLPTS